MCKYSTVAKGASVVLVHGAFCGAWSYWKIGPALTNREIRWTGADLPSCKATDASVTAADDAAYVRELIDEIDGPVVVVGKSYGGIVASGASARHPNVVHLLYVAAMMPAPGERYVLMTASARQPEFVDSFRLLDDGRIAMDPEIGARCAFSQATEEDRDVWRRNGAPMSFGSDPSLTFERVGWETIPSTYVVCTEDCAIFPAAQRKWAEQATSVVERPWDHSPGVSHPDDVADLVAKIARSAVA
jgi:pimeloyl-ACP methyl ester carboxylesterase